MKNKELEKMQDIIKTRELVKDELFQKHPDKRHITELIVQYILKNNYIYTTKDDLKSEMWIYKEGIYVPQGRSEIKEIVRKILLQQFTAQLCNEVIAKIETDTFIQQDEFFSHNYVEEVPCMNGILNVMTGKLKQFTHEKIFFSKIPITYDSTKDCPNIKKHFQTVLSSKEDIKTMFELLGYCLLKENKFEKAFMFEGFGRNGKTKTLELIKRFLGIENCAAVPLQNMHEDSFEICELFGKYVNLAGDLSREDLKSTGMFKMLIGRDLISANRKFLRALKFTNFSKCIFACNELPRVYDLSLGFWSRWLIFSFPYTFVDKEEYDTLQEKTMFRIKNSEIMSQLTTPDELSGLLNSALEGLHRLIENNDFSITQGVGDIMNFWIRKSDSFQAFCMDCIEEDYASNIPKTELRHVFSQYQHTWKIKGTSDKNIKAVLQEMFGADEGRIGDKFEQQNTWVGIRFKENYKDFLSSSQGSKGFSPLYKTSKFCIESKKGDYPDYQNKESLSNEEISVDEAEEVMEDFKK